MRQRHARLGPVFAVVLLIVPAVLVAVGVLAPPASAGPAGTVAAAEPVGAKLTGPSIVATQSTQKFLLNAWGGPAMLSNGTIVGNISFYATLVGPNLTGVSLVPSSYTWTSNVTEDAALAVGNATEAISIDLLISSLYHGKNESTNLTYTINIVQPYVISATLVAGSTWVQTFTVYVTLDGSVIGNVSVPALQANGTYPLKFTYPTLGLSSGEHTFAISLAQEHGLVTFANGSTEFSETVYVTGPAPDYTLWYIAGIVAFFGAIFIFLTRVAARRRGAPRR